MFEHSERTKYKPKLSGRTSNRTKVFTPKNRKIFARNISTSNAYLDLVKCPDHCEFVLDSRWNGPVNLVTFPFFFSFSLARIIQYLVYFAIFFSFLLFNFFKFVPMVLVAVAVAVPATTSMTISIWPKWYMIIYETESRLHVLNLRHWIRWLVGIRCGNTFKSNVHLRSYPAPSLSASMHRRNAV